MADLEQVEETLRALIRTTVPESQQKGFLARLDPDLSALTKDELLELAEAQGVDVSDRPTKAELVARLEGGA